MDTEQKCRELLWRAGRQSVIGFIGLFCIAAYLRWSRPTPDFAAVSKLGQQYGIAVVWSGERFPYRIPNYTLTGRNPAPRDVTPYIPVLVSELARLPVDLVRKSGLRKVVFCGDLSVSGMRAGAAADEPAGVLFLDVSGEPLNESAEGHSIMHEFFHILDWRLNHLRLKDPNLLDDSHWSAFNPRGFRYVGRGAGIKMSDRNVGLERNDLPGFINRYSTANAGEDKAELFSLMINSLPMVELHAAFDPCLRAKVQHMRVRLQQVCPSMDDHYWSWSYTHPVSRRPQL